MSKKSPKMDSKLKRSETYTKRRPTIPSDFAEQVINLEMELDLHKNIETLKQLLELYSVSST